MWTRDANGRLVRPWDRVLPDWRGGWAVPRAFVILTMFGVTVYVALFVALALLITTPVRRRRL